jgi:hypothetical protein
MSRRSNVQAMLSKSASLPRATASVLERQHTLGPHLCVQREAAGPAIHPTASFLVREVVDSPGCPLDAATRSLMEPRFGYDLSRVRVHIDERAAESARAVSARAYTAGTHVVFGDGQYTPGSPGGQRLLAHELTHVAQQATGPVEGTTLGEDLSISHPADRFEGEARSVAARIVAGPVGESKGVSGLPPQSTQANSGPLFLQRDTAGDVGAVAGVAGAVLGLGALVVGLLQLKSARETPAQPTGGLSLTNVQFGPYQAPHSPEQTAAPISSPTSPAPTPQTTPLPSRNDILSISASEDSAATIGLMVRSDGHNIIEGYTQEQDVKGYTGGSTGDNANVTFRVSPIAGADPSIAEAGLLVDGINTSGSRLQRFAGRMRVRGNGNVVCDEIHKTMGPGTVDRSDSPPYAVVRLQDPAAPGSSADSTAVPSGGSVLPRFDVPNPPILDGPGGLP